jgi:hypothetical protein
MQFETPEWLAASPELWARLERYRAAGVKLRAVNAELLDALRDLSEDYLGACGPIELGDDDVPKALLQALAIIAKTDLEEDAA